MSRIILLILLFPALLLADRIVFELDENGVIVSGHLEKSVPDPDPDPVPTGNFDVVPDDSGITVKLNYEGPKLKEAKIIASPAGSDKYPPVTKTFTGTEARLSIKDMQAEWPDVKPWWVVRLRVVCTTADGQTLVIPDKVVQMTGKQVPDQPETSFIPDIPPNAIIAANVLEGIKLIESNRSTGVPVVIRNFDIKTPTLPDKQIKIYSNNRDIFILNNKFSGDDRGMSWLHHATIFIEAGAKNIYVAGNDFRDAPASCIIGGYRPDNWVFENNKARNVRQWMHIFYNRGPRQQKLIIANNDVSARFRTIELQSNGFDARDPSKVYVTSGTKILNNVIECVTARDMALSLACPSNDDMLVAGNTIKLTKKNSPEDADPKYGGIGYCVEVFAGIFRNNTLVNGTIGFALEGHQSIHGSFIANTNKFIDTERDIGFQNGGEYNSKHVIEPR